MKVTAIIPDDVIQDVKEFAGGKNTTESLLTALQDWLYQKRLEKLTNQLSKEPLNFQDGYSPETIRDLSNRSDRS